ncbi:MAG: transporter [Sterolibacterium sp.]
MALRGESFSQAGACAVGRIAALAATLLAVSLQAHAIECDPGDYESPVPGHDLALIYMQHATRSKQYVNGSQALDNAKLSSDVTLLRYTHPMQLDMGVFNPQFVLPIARTDATDNLSALGSSSGVGDLMLVFPVWLVGDRVARRHFAAGPYVFVPIGSYDKNKPSNIGENRWKMAFQAGGVTGIGKSDFTLDVVFDVTYFGKNDKLGPTEKTLRQDPLSQLQGALSYHISSATRVALSLYRTWGGETRVDGVAQSDRVKTDKFLLTASTFVDPQNQLLISWGRDISVENGLKENSRVNFRYLHVY